MPIVHRWPLTLTQRTLHSPMPRSSRRIGGNDGDLRSKTRTLDGPIRTVADGAPPT